MYDAQKARLATLEYFNGDELATNVFMTKYCLRDNKGHFLELTPADMHARMAREFSRIEDKFGTDQPGHLSEEEVYSYFENFKYIVPQGSPMMGIGNNEVAVSLSNCVVVDSPEDNVSSIIDTGKDLANLFKRRCGVGLDISHLRPEGAPVHNSARTTTGAWSFADFYSYVCRMIGQNGRRGALMISMDIRHPDIEKFVTMKHDLMKVTGANVSVKISDSFMEAVENNETFTLQFPIEGEPEFTHEIQAVELWEEIINSAAKTAEPGLLMWDNITKNLPAHEYAQFKTLTTNPCIVGETLIAVADGRNAVSIRQLAEEGKDVPVYSTNTKTGQVEIKLGRNPRKTGSHKEVWRLTLDDGSYLDATPDHKILTKELKYISLKALQEGQSVFPFYSFDSNKYRQVCGVGAKMLGGARRNRRQYRVIHEFYNGIVDAKKYAIHHSDFDCKNDNINNLITMTHEDHRDLHSKLMMGENNPYHHMTDEWKFNFASHPGEKNPKYSGHSNDELLDSGRLLFEKHGKITKKMWVKYAKENGYPQHLGNDFRFGTFTNFKNQVASNHKVKSVEYLGYQDVYNITVDDNHNYHIITSHEDEKFIKSSGLCIKNCGEIPLSAYDSCRLISLNLKHLVKNAFEESAAFDFNKLKEIAAVGMRLSDDLVELELEKLENIKNKADTEDERVLWGKLWQAAHDGRRTGLGTHGLADAIARLNLKYDSADAIAMIDKIFETIRNAAYEESVYLAQERGAFPAFDWSQEKRNAYIKRLPKNLSEKIETFGRRNIAILTNAPTGSVSILSQTSSGLEPVFRNSYTRRRKLSHNEQHLEADFVDDMGDKWVEYEVLHHNVQEWLQMQENTDVPIPALFVESNNIEGMARIAVQAAIQQHIDHSISSTINLPKGTAASVVGDLYMEGWRRGLKGLTVYVEGSRSGVLVTNKREDSTQFPQHTAPKRPIELPCNIHHATIHGKKWVIMVGLMDDKPYEVMGGLSNLIEIPKNRASGILVKHPRKTMNSIYDLHIGTNGDTVIVKDLVSAFDNPNHSAFTRMISLGLRHGASIQFTVEQLQKDRDSDMFSFAKCVARVLKNYIPDGQTATEKTCTECNTEGLIYVEGCITCKNCGFAKCG